MSENKKRRLVKVCVEVFEHPEFCNTSCEVDVVDSCSFLSESEAGCYLFGGDELEMNDENSYDGIYLKNKKCLKYYQSAGFQKGRAG